VKIFTTVGATISVLGLLQAACGTANVAQISAAAEAEGAALVVADSGSGTANSLDVSLDPVPSPLSVSEESDLIFNILTGEIPQPQVMNGSANAL